MTVYTFRTFDLHPVCDTPDGEPGVTVVEVSENAALVGFTPDLQVVFIERELTEQEIERKARAKEVEELQDDLRAHAYKAGKEQLADLDAQELEQQLEQAESEGSPSSGDNE